MKRRFHLLTGAMAGCLLLIAFSAPSHASELLLKVNEKNWKIDPMAAGWIHNYPKTFFGGQEVVLPATTSLSLAPTRPPLPLEVRMIEGVDRTRASAWLTKNVVPSIDRPPQNVVIDQDAEGGVVFQGFGLEGRNLNFSEAIPLFRQALSQAPDEVRLPVLRTPPDVEVKSEVLRAQGIRELLSTGETVFKGSPANRVTNIKAGLRRFNGVLIPAKTEFVLGEILGEVNEKTGYKKELVIKGDKTLPEYGGGLCQVSTTIYRGALWAGLPITKRKNHSYAVSYYNPQGLDATIYPPTVDLKFLNDSPSSILIQTMTNERGEAYVSYYGTKDDRSVALLGPRYYKFISVPPPRTEITAQLAPGETQKVGEAHEGFQASWFRQVAYETPEKQPLKEHIYSSYEARPLYTLIGKEPEKSPSESTGG